MVLGTSVATYLSAILGIGLILVFDRSRYGRFAWVFMGVIALYMIAPETVTRLVTANRDERSIETASGRIPTWEIVLDQIVPKSPYVGFGFGYGEAMVRLGYAWGGARMTHMHSAVLSALVNLGIAGLTLLVLFWAATYRQIFKIKDRKVLGLFGAAVTATIINSLATESITGPVNAVWISHMLLFGAAALAAEPRESRPGRQIPT